LTPACIIHDDISLSLSFSLSLSPSLPPSPSPFPLSFSPPFYLSPHLLRYTFFDKRRAFHVDVTSIGWTNGGDRLCKYASGAIVRFACALCSASGLCKYTPYANRQRGLNACSQSRVSAVGPLSSISFSLSLLSIVSRYSRQVPSISRVRVLPHFAEICKSVFIFFLEKKFSKLLPNLQL